MLVTVKTRLQQSKANKLDRLAEKNDRSVAAELRIAIDKHLSEASGKDGRK